MAYVDLNSDLGESFGQHKIGEDEEMMKIISSDMPKLGRMMPGADIRFKAVSVGEAEAVARERHERQAALIGAIERFSGSVEQLEHLLMTQNLISGVTAG